MKLLLLLLLSVACFAQEEKSDKPKTKLESFMAQDGIVIVQGFSTVAKIRGMMDSAISIDSKEITNASTGKKEYGITIEVTRNLGSGISRESTSYIDYDELESLIQGIDYISKVDKASTKLDDFQATYSTKDDLTVSVFSGALGLFSNPKNSSTYLSVSSGIIGKATAYFKKEDIAQVREAFVKAKQKLDGLR